MRNPLGRQAMTTATQALHQERRSVRKAALVIALVFEGIVSHSAPLLAANPVPMINQPLVPGTAAPGGNAFALTVNGTGFVSGSSVDWNGSPRTTTFVSGSQLTAAINAADIAVAGTPSVTVVNPAPGGGRSNALFFSVTTNTPSISLAATDYLTGSRSQAVAAADLNGDGKLDLVVGNLDSATVSVFLGDGTGSFKAHVDFATGLYPNSLAIRDFNGDGKPDLALANGSGTVSILLGNGDGTFQSQVTYPVGRQPISVAVADLNGDGQLDLAVADFTDGFVSVLLGNGDGTFQPSVEYPTGRVPSTIIIGDFNGDGKLDVATSNFAPGGYTVPPGYINILLGNGDGTFQAPVAFVAGPNPDTVVVADLNNDGAL